MIISNAAACFVGTWSHVCKENVCVEQQRWTCVWCPWEASLPVSDTRALSLLFHRFWPSGAWLAANVSLDSATGWSVSAPNLIFLDVSQFQPWQACWQPCEAGYWLRALCSKLCGYRAVGPKCRRFLTGQRNRLLVVLSCWDTHFMASLTFPTGLKLGAVLGWNLVLRSTNLARAQSSSVNCAQSRNYWPTTDRAHSCCWDTWLVDYFSVVTMLNNYFNAFRYMESK